MENGEGIKKTELYFLVSLILVYSRIVTNHYTKKKLLHSL